MRHNEEQSGLQGVVDLKGFTLIEVVIAMVILGILVAVAAVKSTGVSSASARGAAEMIQGDIRYAQEAAMAEHAAQSVIFASGSSSYTIGPETQELPSGVTISNDFTVTFDSLGEPTEGGAVSISADGQTKTITVSDYTGKVSIS